MYWNYSYTEKIKLYAYTINHKRISKNKTSLKYCILNIIIYYSRLKNYESIAILFAHHTWKILGHIRKVKISDTNYIAYTGIATRDLLNLLITQKKM